MAGIILVILLTWLKIKNQKSTLIKGKLLDERTILNSVYHKGAVQIIHTDILDGGWAEVNTVTDIGGKL